MIHIVINIRYQFKFSIKCSIVHFFQEQFRKYSGLNLSDLVNFREFCIEICIQCAIDARYPR